MRPFWSPLSALILADLGFFAPPLLLRKRIESGRQVELIYAGDRMWPAIRHGEHVQMEPRGRCAPGDVVVAAPGGIPDLLRVLSCRGDALLLCADADPADPALLRKEEVLAAVRARPAQSGKVLRTARRIVLDLQEAFLRNAVSGGTPEETVRRKYEAQAAFYAGERGSNLDSLVLDRIRARVAPGGRILVAGSGTGRECLALEAEGWSVTGVDFSKAMVERAREGALERGSRVEYHQADLREHREPPGSLAAVLFTYDVYSLIQGTARRIELLKRMRLWLGAGGFVLLSARRVRGLYQHFLLSAQALRRHGEGGSREWGESHTRWISPDGALSRSFIRVFTSRQLRREARRAGYAMGSWEGGHAILIPRDSAGGRT
jgi:SAM-dependent methyltransferase